MKKIKRIFEEERKERRESGEREYQNNNTTRNNGCSKEAFKIEEGSIPIMVSVPHAVNHYRNGKIKLADRYTGGIARYLHKVTNYHLIYNCKFNNCDYNYDTYNSNKYQQA